MKFYRLLLLGLFLCCAQMVTAQGNCYESQREKGIQLYNQGDYAGAAKNFKAAKTCLGVPADNDLDAWIAKCTIVVRISPRRIEFAATGGEEQCVEVSTNAKSFQVTNAPSWCKVSHQGKMIYVSCQDNNNVAAREARLVVSSGGKTASLEVVQRAADLEMEFQPEILEFSSKVETKNVMVTSNAVDWEVESYPTWLVAARHDDTLVVTCFNNVSSELRTAELVLAASGQLFPLEVRQQPGDTVISADRHEYVVASEGGDFGFKVNSNIASWKAVTSDNWMVLKQSADSVTVTAYENPSVFSRHGTVRLACGNHFSEVIVHQKAYVTPFTLPASELESLSDSGKESINVTSYPSNLKVIVDDTITRYTPFSYHIDFEHHSMLMGFERKEFLFNEKQQDIEFRPGLRFASVTFGGATNIGLMTGFVSANSFGAFSHFQVSRPLVKDFDLVDTDLWSGYHFSVGPVYCPIQYLGLYGGLGVGLHGICPEDRPELPRFGLDYELGVMGFYKNVTVSMGLYGSNVQNQTKYGFLFGIGGYLKRYYDDRFGYCASDSRRWWSVSYVTRPAVQGKGVMFGDLGKEIARGYIKTMFTRPGDQPTDSIRNFDVSAGILFTPVNGLIDVCIGAGPELNLKGMDQRFQSVGAEVGVILNIWRFPIMVMFHEANLFKEPRPYIDFGIGFHFGEFGRSSYK